MREFGDIMVPSGVEADLKVAANAGGANRVAGPRAGWVGAMSRRLVLLLLLAGLMAPLAAADPPEWDWTIPSGITLEATGPDGRVVTFDVSATWDGNVATVTCTPPSGSTFPIDRTVVNCVATYEAEQDEREFDVRIRDTTPPVVTVPADMDVETEDPNGAVVTFAASAYDLVDGDLPVVCSPPSGSLFPVGTTAVTCTASDTRENMGSATFNVNVIFPEPRTESTLR